MSFSYKIYGLSVKSSRQIKILDEKPIKEVDLVVSWNTGDKDIQNSGLSWEAIITPQLKHKARIKFYQSIAGEDIFYKIFFDNELGGISAVVNKTNGKLWITHHQEELPSNLDSYFVGVFLGCYLRLSNILCLHASVVNLNNEAIVLLGKKKSGKSTTAAAFAKLGYKVLSDDIAVIKRHDNIFYVESGYPKVRLRPKSLAVIHPGTHNEDFVSVNSHKDSRYSDINESFEENTLALGAIYILGETVNDNDMPFVEPMTSERLIMLHQNTFAPFIVTPKLRIKEFKELGVLVDHVPIRNLRFGRNVEMVNQQCLTVIRDFQLIKN